jgi:hypothetical protein
VGALAEQIADFASKSGVAPKSIGTEYLESSKSLVMTLGYRDDEPAYKIQLHCVELADSSASGLGDLAALESKMSAAASRFQDVICHELFITGEGRFYMVFMVVA